jgi:hypothetical protein
MKRPGLVAPLAHAQPCAACEARSQWHRELARFVLGAFCGVFGFALLAVGALVFFGGVCLVFASAAIASGEGTAAGVVSAVLSLALLAVGCAAFALFDWLERRLDLRDPRLG